MLENIRIRSLGVIDQAEIEIGPGFTALTGETGAGKTMVLTALGLVLGSKSEASLVRSGAERLAVAATFRAPAEIADAVIEQGGEVEEGSVVLARMVTPDGRSRALVGGASAPAAVLAHLGEELISVHAQMSSSRLLKPSRQREILDRFGGHQDLLQEYKKSYQALKLAEMELQSYLEDQRNASAIAAELSSLISLVDEVRPEINEYSHIESQISKLAHHDEIARAVELARSVIGDESGVEDLLGKMRRDFESVKGRDSNLDALIERTVDLSVLANELGADLSRYQSDLDIDPASLDAAHARMSKFQTLLRRFAEEQSDLGMGSLLKRYSEAKDRLALLSSGEEQIGILRDQLEQSRLHTAKAAQALSIARTRAAHSLAETVTSEVRALAMPHATVNVEISRKESRDGLEVDGSTYSFDSNGIDHVELQLAATATTPSVPIAKGASGGELSRVMLALEVVLASADPVPTYIFDEVDAGIGGQAALEVGRRLARLAQHAQVLVVTHLAQVAAFADHHIVVTKGESGSITASEVREVSGREREEELARMMAGLAESSTAQASAAELLALGARGR